MAKSASERLKTKKGPKIVDMDKDFAGIRAGERMLVGTPMMVNDYVSKIPTGEVRSIERLRNELARRHKCDKMCPVSTAIFVRIVAEAAIEEMDAGKQVDQVAPFWRVIAPGDKIAKKLSIDPGWIAHQRTLETSIENPGPGD
ncbi:MAG: hypothetical protein AAGE61_13735 [Pseudomonadota bacterium]